MIEVKAEKQAPWKPVVPKRTSEGYGNIELEEVMLLKKSLEEEVKKEGEINNCATYNAIQQSYMQFIKSKNIVSAYNLYTYTNVLPSTSYSGMFEVIQEAYEEFLPRDLWESALHLKGLTGVHPDIKRSKIFFTKNAVEKAIKNNTITYSDVILDIIKAVFSVQ